MLCGGLVNLQFELFHSVSQHLSLSELSETSFAASTDSVLLSLPD